MRRFVMFTVVGIIQFAVDNLLYAAFVMRLGLPLAGNVASRFLAVLLGYALNALLTFGAARYAAGELARYLLLWGAMTCLSTAALGGIGSIPGIDERNAAYVLVKLGTELLLSVLSFSAMKFWVFRPTRAARPARP